MTLSPRRPFADLAPRFLELKDGRKVVIRQLQKNEDDAAALHRFLNDVRDQAPNDYVKRFPLQTTEAGCVSTSPHDYVTQASREAFEVHVMTDPDGEIVGLLDYSERFRSKFLAPLGLVKKECEANMLVKHDYQNSGGTTLLARDAAREMRKGGYQRVYANRNVDGKRHIDLSTSRDDHRDDSGSILQGDS